MHIYANMMFKEGFIIEFGEIKRFFLFGVKF